MLGRLVGWTVNAVEHLGQHGGRVKERFQYILKSERDK